MALPIAFPTMEPNAKPRHLGENLLTAIIEMMLTPAKSTINNVLKMSVWASNQ
jgi:hypothetical protein